jgi:hypothetical protein
MGWKSGIRRRLITDPDSVVTRAPDPGSGSVTLLVMYSKSNLPVEFQISACSALFFLVPSSSALYKKSVSSTLQRVRLPRLTNFDYLIFNFILYLRVHYMFTVSNICAFLKF